MSEPESGVHVDFSDEMAYGDYLRLDRLLQAQEPRSVPVQHEEMLFIIQHQTSELWMKLMIHELMAAIVHVRTDRLNPSFKILARVGHIQRMLFEQWSVLETMTPSDYLSFRDALGHASGFQSYQFRAIEFLLGNKSAHALAPFRHDPQVHGWLSELLAAPSIYDEFLRQLARRGHPIPPERIERGWAEPYERHPGVEAVFKRIYENAEGFWDEYEMCEKLLDVEERFLLWRFRHMKTVQRIIGLKRGTGGSAGVPYLQKGMEVRLFPELWDVRTLLERGEKLPDHE